MIVWLYHHLMVQLSFGYIFFSKLSNSYGQVINQRGTIIQSSHCPIVLYWRICRYVVHRFWNQVQKCLPCCYVQTSFRVKNLQTSITPTFLTDIISAIVGGVNSVSWGLTVLQSFGTSVSKAIYTYIYS